LNDPLRPLIQTLGHEFSNRTLLDVALTHRSAGPLHNERLEFLGDALLGLIVAEELYRRFPMADEGQLTRLRASLVKKETLAALAREIDLGRHLRLGEGERRTGGWHRDSILANAFEAVVGAIYLDSGYDTCRDKVVTLFRERLSGAIPDTLPKDPKTELQEWLQSRRQPLPGYEVVSVDGEHHNQVFTVQCSCPGLDASVIGQGSSRRRAEQEAAQKLLEALRASSTKTAD
jgi:ribonuclease-3